MAEQTDKPSVPSGRRTVTSVGRAIAAIDELARRIEVNPSSASRLLATLEQSGLVTRQRSGRYRLGLRFVALADRVLAGLDVRELARPHLHSLVEQTGETATLSIPAAGEAVTVDFVPGSSSVVSMARVGRPNPLHATAIGKVMLAFGAGTLPPSDGLIRFTEKTLIEHDVLRDAVETVRRAGWAEAVGERETDLAALAAPVRGAPDRLVAIVGLQGPLARMTNARRREMLPLLLDVAARLSRELGATG
jgi:DNA-binding IclR family transcriptional regulator